MNRPRSLQDHMTPVGDRVSHEYTITVIGLEDEVLHQLGIACAYSGAIGVSGNIGDYVTAADVLDNAADAIAGYHLRKNGINVPGKDVTIVGIKAKEVRIRGPIEDRTYALAVIAAAKQILKDRHDQRLIVPPNNGELTRTAL